MSLTLNAEPVPLNRDVQGVIRVGGTRVTLDTVARAFGEGMTAEGIVEQYPTLRLADVYSVIAFMLNHPADVENYLREQDELGVKIRSAVESRFSPDGLRARLTARSRSE